jgi:hypothetical protein
MSCAHSFATHLLESDVDIYHPNLTRTRESVDDGALYASHRGVMILRTASRWADDAAGIAGDGYTGV